MLCVFRLMSTARVDDCKNLFREIHSQYLVVHVLPAREGDDADRYTRIVASPNPFSSRFDVSFELPEPCDAKLRLYDVYGKLAYTKDLGTLGTGKHTETIVPNVIDGTYVLNVTAGSRVLRTIVVKKGGAR